MLNRLCSSLFKYQTLINKTNNTLHSSFALKYQFSRRKGMEENIKQKSIQQQQQKPQNPINNNTEEPNTYSPEGLLQLSKAKILMMQFFPVTLLLTPTLLYCEAFYDPNFLLGTLLAQKYSTLMLLMNADFQQNKKLSFFLMFMMAGFHSLSGYYSLGTPLGMALITIMLPFKFCNEKQRYTQTERQRMKNMMNIRVLYFFIFTLLTTIKAFHYEAVYEMEKKLTEMNQENMKDIVEKNTQ